MIAYAETHRQASHAQCAHCCAPQEEIAARLLAKAWLACLLEQEFHPCSTGITACGSSQTKQQVQSCRSDGSSYSLCVCQAATAAFVMSVITNGLIRSLQVEVSHVAASAYLLTEQVQTYVSLCRLKVIAAIVSVPSHCHSSLTGLLC